VDHLDHVELLRGGVPEPGGTWADLGSGTGAFTLALAELLGPDAVIHAVDRDRGALHDLERAMSARFPAVTLRAVVGDFTDALDLPPLDGIVMANSLHFQRDREAVARHVVRWLRSGGRLIVVEYDADTGNPWVPHPFSYRTWVELAGRIGLRDVRPIGRVPSRFLGAIYSAVAVVPEALPRD
jgi:ubiquinone/menaquinone biosynthesis C-methylase UbiE